MGIAGGARRSVRGGDLRRLEPRMLLQQRHQTLSGDPRWPREHRRESSRASSESSARGVASPRKLMPVRMRVRSSANRSVSASPRARLRIGNRRFSSPRSAVTAPSKAGSPPSPPPHEQKKATKSKKRQRKVLDPKRRDEENKSRQEVSEGGFNHEYIIRDASEGITTTDARTMD